MCLHFPFGAKASPQEAPAPPSPLKLTDDSRIHCAAEQQTLGDEKNELVQSVDSDRRFAIVACGGIWSWFATHPLAGTLKYFYLLPLGVSLLFVLKRFVANAAIDQIGSYVRNMEARIMPNDPNTPCAQLAGWETWLKPNRSEWFRLYDVLFWGALCCGNVLVAWRLWLVNQ